MGLPITGKLETKFLEAKIETGDAKQALGEDLSPAAIAFKGVAKDTEGGGFEVEVKVALSTAGLARVMQSLTAKDRAALKQMEKISEQLEQWHARQGARRAGGCGDRGQGDRRRCRAGRSRLSRKEDVAGDAKGKGDLPDEGGREAPAVHVRPHKVKGPGADDEVVEALRDMALVSGISSKRRYKVGNRLTPTLEFDTAAARYRVKGLPIVVTNYFRDDDGYYLEATVSDNYRLGRTKIVVVEGTGITWDYTFKKKA